MPFEPAANGAAFVPWISTAGMMGELQPRPPLLKRLRPVGFGLRQAEVQLGRQIELVILCMSS